MTSTTIVAKVSKNAKKRQSKNYKTKFLLQFEKYITPVIFEMYDCDKTRRDIFETLEECVQLHDYKSAQHFVRNCPTFYEWCNYISSNDTFKHVGKLCGVTWLHSMESLQFVCNSIMHPLLQQTQSSCVLALNVTSGFSEACMKAYGLPICCTGKQDASFIPMQRPNLKTELKVLYFDIHIINIPLEHLTTLLPDVSVIVFAGPMCLFPYLYHLNDRLIGMHKFYRRVYQTFGVAADRVVFDGDLSSTCVVVYSRTNDMLSHLTMHNILEDPTNALRHHYIRHALAGNIPDYWKYVLSKIPMATFFKMVPPFRKKCSFDEMLVDVFSNSSQNDTIDVDQTPEQQAKFENAFGDNLTLLDCCQ